MKCGRVLAAALLIVVAAGSPVAGSRIISRGGAACPSLNWRILRPAQACTCMPCAVSVAFFVHVSVAGRFVFSPDCKVTSSDCRRISQDIVRCFGKKLAPGDVPRWTRTPAPASELPTWAELGDQSSATTFRHGPAASPLCRPENTGSVIAQSDGRQPCCTSGPSCALSAAAYTFFDTRCARGSLRRLHCRCAKLDHAEDHVEIRKAIEDHDGIWRG